jgi:hypothetical protein
MESRYAYSVSDVIGKRCDVELEELTGSWPENGAGKASDSHVVFVSKVR